MCECERSEEHTSELQSHLNLVCRLLLEKKNILFLYVFKSLLFIVYRLVSHRRYTCVLRLVRSTRLRVASAACRDTDVSFFFFNDTAPTEFYSLSLHDALPI